MDTNTGLTQSGQPPQGGDFGGAADSSAAPAGPNRAQLEPAASAAVQETPQPPLAPPSWQAPASPLQPEMPPASRALPSAQSPLAIKPSWQVQAMQNVWAQQHNSSQAPPTTVTPYSPQTSEPYLQQPYQFAGQQPLQAQQLQPPTSGPPQVPPQQPPAYPTNYEPPAKSSKGWIIAIILLFILGAAGAAAIFILARGGDTPQAGDAFQVAMANTFKTQTYNETLTIGDSKSKNVVTQKRSADFRKLDEPHLYADNIAAPGQDQTEVTVIGDDYYVKKHFSEESLAKALPEQAPLLRGANKQWTKVIQDGTPLVDPVVSALGVTQALQTMRIVVPSPLLVGYFRDDEQKQLNDFVTQNNIYTPNEPASEKLENTDAWHYQVTVNPNKLRELNTKAAGMHAAKQPESVGDQLKDVPTQMEIWIRKDDKHIVQYSYQQGDALYTYRYDKLNQQVDVAAPKIPGTAPAGQSASDADVKTAADTVFNTMASYLTQGNALPGDQTTLDEFVSQKLEATLREQFAIRYQEGAPEKGYIFYRSGSVCKSDNTGIEETGGITSFAVLTKLSGSLYCVDNTD